MTNTRISTISQANREFENIRLSVAAYSAKAISAKLQAPLSAADLREALVRELAKVEWKDGGYVQQVERETNRPIEGGMSIAQAQAFAVRYTPVAALDKDGAGAVIFFDNTIGKNVVAVRGTDAPANTMQDLVQADGSIAQNRLPAYQTALLANFVLRETTPAGQGVQQLTVQGISSGADDLLSATLGSLGNNLQTFSPILGGVANLAIQDGLAPRLVASGAAVGTGRALAGITDIAAHSEAAPEAYVIAAIVGGDRVTAINGPSVSEQQMQGFVNQYTDALARLRVDIQGMDALAISTTGPSIIDKLNGGLPGQASLLPIPWTASLPDVMFNHSSKTAMNAAEERLSLIKGDESIATMSQANAALVRTFTPLPGIPLEGMESILPNSGADANTPIAGASVGGHVNPNHSANYDFPDTAGAGRGNVNPPLISPDTVFSPATALTSYTGNNAITIQPGDTVGSIAVRYGMSAKDFGDYLKELYGEGADLNSIVAGNKLPIPPDVYERTLGGINGLDMPTEPGSTAEAPPALLVDPQDSSCNPEDPTSANAINGHDHQSDNHLNLADIPAPELASHFRGGNAGGAYGAGQLGGFDVLPLNGSASFLVNADGDIAGEINRLPNGDLQIKNLHGEAVYVNQVGAVLSQEDYLQAQQDAETQAQYGQAASAVGLMNSIIGLQNWDDMGDLQRLAAVTSIYNALDKMSGGGALPGDLGTAASVLGLLNALDSGNMGSALYSGLSLVEHLTFDAATKMGLVTETFGGNFMPGLNLVLALDSGDPVSILAAAVNFIPGWGQVASVVITLLGSMFESDIPMKEGQAHAEWDAQGNTIVITDQDAEGGGATAIGWMNSIVAGLQAQLAATHDAAGNSYALIPNLLPAIGYQYDADGMNYGSAPGHLYLRWVDDSGQSQTRYYDGQGNREDGTGETLAGDFMAHAQGAIAPAWQVQTVLAHWQQGQGIHLPDGQAGLPRELADGIHQSLQALTLELPAPPALTSSLIDIDADGYLEQTQWLAANHQILSIDANGDGQIGAGELLSLGGSALNSLNWLDANNDKVLSASDPAFGALRLWMDINSDGQSQGETTSLSQAGITAIDFGSNPPAIVRADGSRSTLTEQTLQGDILGVRYTATVGGVLEAKERGETVLHAVNTRQFDGQADHMHGGDADTDGTAEGEAVLINAHDSRLSSTTARTLANRLAFVPIAATTQAQAQRDVTAAMVRSAESALFGVTSGAAPLVALALGAGALQWPVVAAAALSPVQAEGDGNALSASVQASPADPTPNLQPAPATVQTKGERLDATGIDLTALQIGRIITGVQPIADEGPAVSAFDASNQALAQAERAQAATDSVASLASSSIAADSSSDVASGLSATLQGITGTGDDMQLTYPSVMGELVAGTEDIGLRIAASLLLANDGTLNAGDPSRPLLSIRAVGSPSHGQVALRINEAGGTEVVFIPESNYHGPASFSYTVTDQYGLSTVATATLEITRVNDAPTPVADAASGDEDATLMFTAASLLANDFDVDSAVDGDVLRITRVGLAEHGQVFLQADGNIRFVPDLNYNGPAQFSYWVSDRSEAAMAAASGGSIPGGVGLESLGTMHLTVLPVNDLPVVTGETIASDEDVVLTINPALLLANDSDVDSATNGQVLTISAVSGAQHGAVVLRADGTVQFTPEQDYFGPASFVYTVDDGNGGQVQSTAVVNLAPVNDVPVVNDELLIGKRNATYTLSQAALLANDTDLETPGSLTIVAVQGMSHGTAVLNANGSVTFTPEPGYAGRGRFEYVVQDADGGQAVAATEIDFATINVNPLATDDSFIGFEDIAFVIQANQLLANDADPDASGLAAMKLDAVRNASHGTVSLQADGSVRFDPTANFYGTASFEYRCNDGEGGQTWATAYLNVQSVNDAPVITNIWYASGVDATVTVMPASLENGEITYFLQDDPYRQNGGVIAYDPDGDSSAITLSISGGPQHGHAWANVVVPSSAPAFMTHDAAPAYFTPQAGAWQYFSHQGDPYSGSDPFTVTVTDAQGASTSAMVYAAHQGSSAGGGGKCPIVMDLTGDGIELIRPENSDIFADVNGDGWRERIGWAADEDGVLTFDANRDGRITENAEVSFVGYKEGARTDLDGLAAFDTDGDGKLSAGDAAWSQFGVLRDANGNGRQDAGELVSLDQLGVTAIGLQRQGSPRLDNGNVVFGTTDVTYADGHIGQAGDVMFAGENVPLPAAVQAVLPPLPPPTEEEDVARLAVLMSQYGALAEGPSEPLGFVDWTEASPIQSPAEAMALALVQGDHFGTSPTGNP